MNPPQEPIGVLFVCLGNICRSPMAEGAFRHAVEERELQQHFLIDSAGTSGWHINEPPDRRAQNAAADRGMNISQQASRIVTAEDFDRFHYIVAMDHSNLNSLEASKPEGSKATVDMLMSWSGSIREVPDPYYGGEDGFDHCLDLITQGAQSLLDNILNDHFS